MKNKILVLIIGESGVGKTTIANYMEKNFGLKQVASYTNRPPRFDGEIGHQFLGEQNIDKIKEMFPNRVAETEYSGHFYFATAEQMDECDIYVINPGAVEELKRKYHGHKMIKVVLIEDTPINKAVHMFKRGDSIDAILKRLQFDRKEFKDVRMLADYIVANVGVDRTATAIRNAIWGWNIIADEA